MTGLVLALLVLAAVVVWLYVDTRGEAGRVDRLERRVVELEQQVGVLIKRSTLGGDDR